MILAILQARMSSSRLPGKVLKKVNDKPILYYQIERIKKSSKIDKLVVATSVNVEDNDIELLKQEKTEENADTFIEEDVAPEEGIYIPPRPPKRRHTTQEEQSDEHLGNDSEA